MNIPNYENVPIVSSGGMLSDAWSLILQQLITALQQNLSNEGFRIPQLPTTTINTLQTQYAASSNPSAYYGDLVYDSNANVLKVNIAGTFKTIQTA
jgi:hypothetical protein